MAARPKVQIRCRTLWLPKRGHTETEYEDAFAFSETHDFPFRAAVADGATEAAFSRAWARRLVEEWKAAGTRSPEAFRSHVARWQVAYQAEIAERSMQAPWYVAAKAEEGAFAAFLGVHVDAGGTWCAVAVGDCCLLHLRDGRLLTSWPLQASEDFHHTPDLVPSRQALAVERVGEASGTWEAEDTFLLATDAAAAWLMRVGPATATRLQTNHFERVVDEARRNGDLRNDDVTLMIIDLQGASIH